MCYGPASNEFMTLGALEHTCCDSLHQALPGMDRLPEELLLHVLSFLEPYDVVLVQAVCRRLKNIARDGNAWKQACFEYSRAESARRRQQLLSSQDARIVQLRQIIESTSDATGDNGVAAADVEHTARTRALANWDPSYEGEDVHFYQEYIQRHAPISLDWIQDEHTSMHESVGMALINEYKDGPAQKVVSSLEGGSVCIYDIGSTSCERPQHTRMLHQTRPGLLTGDAPDARPPSPGPSTETEATDNISVDAHSGKAYIAALNLLNELDLGTMQITRRQRFPFSISALSAAHPSLPLTVGTNVTLHLFDPRAPDTSTTAASSTEISTRCELIGGRPRSPRYSTAHITLSQPGPLSILHPPSSCSNPDMPSDSIWVAGRFTSLLHYDRRTWPRIAGTLFSGARLSCLNLIPYPYIPRSLDLVNNTSATIAEIASAKATPGMTLIAAGEYKGKGSLELYGLPFGPSSDDTDTPAATPAATPETAYRNRQTASKSRLLSVTPHGTRLVFSDGDGNLKWTERDGYNLVRSFNINTDVVDTSVRGNNSASGEDGEAGHGPQQIHAPRGIFASADEGPSDIVRKIVPRMTGSATSSSRTPNNDLTRDDLLLWTGDGRLGMLGFGKQQSEQSREELHAEAEDAEDAAKMRQERQYERRMREALERQADDARIVRGLGMRYGFST